jgi:hypothetical protein
LTGIKEFSPCNSARRDAHVSTFANNRWTLTAELQGDWREMACSCLHDKATYCCASREEHVINAKVNELLDFSAGTFDNRDCLPVKVVRKDARKELRSSWSKLGRLHDDAIARRNCCRERRDHEVQAPGRFRVGESAECGLFPGETTSSDRF